MAGQNPVATDQIVLSASKTRQDYRLSFALLFAGILMFGGFSLFEYWVASTGNYPTSIAPIVAISLLASVGSILITVGAIFTVINWSLLRKSHRAA